jgi:diketogulonate reductase-like aldo/keto reductase
VSIGRGIGPRGFGALALLPGDGLKRAQPVVALLREIGEGHAKTPAQVALRWLIERKGVLPIPGAKNGRQAAGNAEALSFSLVAAEIEALDQATTAWRR